MAGALTGPNGAIGGNVIGGVRLAVEQFNRKNPDCRVEVRDLDTAGDPQTAKPLAQQIVADSSIVALIGPLFSGETKAAGPTFDAAGLPFLSMGTQVSLSANGWHSYFRGIANDEVQGPALARYLTGVAGHRSVCVVMDNTDYGAGLGSSISPAFNRQCEATITAGADLGPVVAKIGEVGPDAVIYAGYSTEAAPLLRRLREAGITAAFATSDGSFGPEFPGATGSEGAGAIVSCGCGPVTDQFLAQYRALTGGTAGQESVEGYDLTAIVLRGIASGRVTRADMLEYLRGYRGDGIAHSYAWTGTGELIAPRVWVYKVR
ncbi:branched-chain amino acid ABC transporter substrate-binding protein [Nocardia jejuensis]|uniref:branched-chain amino acid ABC transporter substrate-binding protein n=1 Tax=Nocardia jejuensis TaxID=328049 RepID=UPI0009FEDB1E|nr:branched-chain amino acid ABC transporter substrate-binding protein [Nocardia jejuensis]